MVNIQKKYPNQGNLKRVWAPQTVYDPQVSKYMVYWSMKHGDGPDIIYYAYANPEFTDIEGEPKVLFNPADGKSCIDGDIVYHDGTFYMFYKTEGHGNGIRVAKTKSLTSGQWQESPEYKQQTTDAVEGAGTFKLIGQDKYILMYDVYMKGKYQFTETTDLDNFKVVDNDVTMDFHPRHGTVIPITRAEPDAPDRQIRPARRHHHTRAQIHGRQGVCRGRKRFCAQRQALCHQGRRACITHASRANTGSIAYRCARLWA